MTGDRNPRRKEGLTPLHLADGEVHLEVYTFIMEKFWKQKRKTPFYQ